jgi:uncharacterized membrane protein
MSPDVSVRDRRGSLMWGKEEDVKEEEDTIITIIFLTLLSVLFTLLIVQAVLRNTKII